MTVGLNDRKLADDLMRQVDARLAAALEQALTRLRFGTVDSVDRATRKASVLLDGQSSPGFTYGEQEPEPGDQVATLARPDGARLIIRITSRDIDDASTFAFFVGG